MSPDTNKLVDPWDHNNIYYMTKSGHEMAGLQTYIKIKWAKIKLLQTPKIGVDNQVSVDNHN